MMSSVKPRKYAPRKPRREHPRSLTVASLGALALAAIGLSGAALLTQDDNDAPSEAAGDAVTTASSSNSASGDAENGTEPKEEAAESPAAESGSAVLSERFLAVSDDPERLMRAEGLGCGAGNASIEVSSDGGSTWNPADTSALEMSGVRGLQFGESGRAQLAYVDGACALQQAQSYVYGGAWETGSNAGEIWTLGEDPEDSGLAISGAEVEAPCTVVDVAGTADAGIVLCDDATVTTSDDGGESWTDPVAVPGAQTVAADGDTFSVVSLMSNDCAGVSARTIDGTDVSESGTCSDIEVSDGQIAASVASSSLYVWVEDQTLRSDDRGLTWN